MKRIEFKATENDVTRLTALRDKLELTFSAIIREAIKLLHKKEITK